MDLLRPLWDDYGLFGVVFVVSLLFFAVRAFQVSVNHRRLRREGTLGQIGMQVAISGVACACSAILCWPELVGLRREWLGLKPRGPVTEAPPPAVPVVKAPASKLPPVKSWEGAFQPVRGAIEKNDMRTLARTLWDALKREPARGADVRLIAEKLPVGHELIVFGKETLDRGDVEGAIGILDMATEVAPLDADGFFYRALARLARKPKPELASAHADLEVAIRKSKPGDLRAVEKRLALYLAETPPNLRGALGDLERLVAARPDDAKLLARRGQKRLEVGFIEGAIADLSSASRALPQDTALKLDVVAARLRLGDLASSTQALNESAELVRALPKDARAALLHGVASFQLKRPTDAISDLSRSIALDAKAADAYYYRARARLELDQFVTARSDLDQAIKLDPQHRNAFYWRGISQRERDPKKALDDLNRSIELSPDPWAYVFKGEILIRWGKRDEAEKAFGDALAAALDDTLHRQIDTTIKKIRAAATPRRQR